MHAYMLQAKCACAATRALDVCRGCHTHVARVCTRGWVCAGGVWVQCVYQGSLIGVLSTESARRRSALPGQERIISAYDAVRCVVRREERGNGGRGANETVFAQISALGSRFACVCVCCAHVEDIRLSCIWVVVAMVVCARISTYTHTQRLSAGGCFAVCAHARARVVCFVSEYNTERDEPIIIGCKAAIKMSCLVALLLLVLPTLVRRCSLCHGGILFR